MGKMNGGGRAVAVILTRASRRPLRAPCRGLRSSPYRRPGPAPSPRRRRAPPTGRPRRPRRAHATPRRGAR